MSKVIKLKHRDVADEPSGETCRRLADAQCIVWQAWAIASAIERGWDAGDHPEINFLAEAMIEILERAGAALDPGVMFADKANDTVGGAA